MEQRMNCLFLNTMSYPKNVILPEETQYNETTKTCFP